MAYDQSFFDWLGQSGFTPSATSNSTGSYSEKGYRQGNTFYSMNALGGLYNQFTSDQTVQNLLKYAKSMTDKANQETMQDRQRVLDEIERFRKESQLDYAGIETRAAADTRAQGAEIMRQLVERQQQLGRTPNPYVMAGIAARVSASGRNDLNTLRTQLAQQRSQNQLSVTELINNVMQNTVRKTLTPETLIQLLQALGKGSAGTSGLNSFLAAMGGQ